MEQHKSYQRLAKSGIDWLFGVLSQLRGNSWTQLAHSLGEQEKYSGTKSQQHHGNSRGHAPKRCCSGATIVAAPDDNVARHRDQQLKNAPAQKPAHCFALQCCRIISHRKTIENDAPHAPQGQHDGDDAANAEEKIARGRYVQERCDFEQKRICRCLRCKKFNTVGSPAERKQR
jgi:hypothetical protein